MFFLMIIVLVPLTTHGILTTHESDTELYIVSYEGVTPVKELNICNPENPFWVLMFVVIAHIFISSLYLFILWKPLRSVLDGISVHETTVEKHVVIEKMLVTNSVVNHTHLSLSHTHSHAN